MSIIASIVGDIVADITGSILGGEGSIPPAAGAWENQNINNWESENSLWEDFGN